MDTDTPHLTPRDLLTLSFLFATALGLAAWLWSVS